MPRIAVPLAAVALTAALLAGCGSSSDEDSVAQTRTAVAPATTSTAPIGASAESCGNTTVAGTTGLRVTGVGCPVGRGIVAAWSNRRACGGATSRPACTVAEYRCIAARTDAGLAVSCARPGHSISFIAKRRG